MASNPASSNMPGGDEHVGVRELRQNLSVYLRRIRDGEAFTVTERGEPVARLGALPPAGGLLAQLVAEGKVRPPSRPGGVGDIVGAEPRPGTPPTEQIISELREDIV